MVGSRNAERPRRRWAPFGDARRLLVRHAFASLCFLGVLRLGEVASRWETGGFGDDAAGDVGSGSVVRAVRRPLGQIDTPGGLAWHLRVVTGDPSVVVVAVCR